MFGQNEVQNQELGDGQALRLAKNEEGLAFSTIQGEGPYAGHPATFVRLHGCNLRCWFCDTKFDDPNDPWLPLDDILDMVDSHGHQLVVITGGEPLLQNILPLCTALHSAGHVVQIETAGTVWIDGIEEVADIVVSPKTPKVHPRAADHARCFKYVIGKDTDIDDEGIPIAATQPGARARPLASPTWPTTPIYYSAMDEYDEDTNAANRRRAAAIALKHGGILTLQLHKLAGLA